MKPSTRAVALALFNQAVAHHKLLRQSLGPPPYSFEQIQALHESRELRRQAYELHQAACAQENRKKTVRPRMTREEKEAVLSAAEDRVRKAHEAWIAVRKKFLHEVEPLERRLLIVHWKMPGRPTWEEKETGYPLVARDREYPLLEALRDAAAADTGGDEYRRVVFVPLLSAFEEYLYAGEALRSLRSNAQQRSYLAAKMTRED